MNFFQSFKQDTNFSGYIRYADAVGRTRREPFVISAEQHRHALTYGEESLRTHYELQQLPEGRDKLIQAVHELRNVVAATMTNAPTDDADTYR